MTLSSQISKVTYEGDGSSTEFNVPFRFVRQADLVVMLTSADGRESELTVSTDYTVAGAGEASGGAVTMNSAPAEGETLTIYRDPEIVQETDYQENDPFPAETHEAALDLLTMIAQANRERIERAIKLPVSSSLSGLTVPEPEAGRALVWNGDGDGMENGPTATDIASAQGYAQTAANGATLATDAANAASASAASAAQSAADAASAAQGAAENISYDNATSGLAATDTQAALDELVELADGKLDPDGSGASLTGLTLSQVTDAGSAAGYDVGAGAGQVPTNSMVAALPVGAVLPLALDTPPSGLLECDGSAVSRTTYAALFAAISDDYGLGDGSTTFNIPDYRGEFLRGWDHGRGADPDAAGRTNRGDTTTGDHVGTRQGDQFESHDHSYLKMSTSVTGGNVGTGTQGNTGSTTGATGGNETRPRNVNVMYCIKY